MRGDIYFAHGFRGLRWGDGAESISQHDSQEFDGGEYRALFSHELFCSPSLFFFSKTLPSLCFCLWGCVFLSSLLVPALSSALWVSLFFPELSLCQSSVPLASLEADWSDHCLFSVLPEAFPHLVWLLYFWWCLSLFSDFVLVLISFFLVSIFFFLFACSLGSFALRETKSSRPHSDFRVFSLLYLWGYNSFSSPEG